MLAEFMSDALDDLRDDALLDPDLAALCDACPVPWVDPYAWEKTRFAMQLLAAGMFPTFFTLGWSVAHASAWGFDLTAANDAPSEGEIFTGYMPAEQRRAVRHRLYCDGIRKPPRRETLSERVAREASEKWGHA